MAHRSAGGVRARRARRRAGHAVSHGRLRRLSATSCRRAPTAARTSSSWPRSWPAGVRPPHNDDQRGMYERLLSATPGLDGEDDRQPLQGRELRRRARRPGPHLLPARGLTIVRDRGFGVPHIYGATRAAAMFGARLRRRRGPAVLHRRAAPRRPRAARARSPAARPATARMDEEQWRRALHRGRPGAPGRPARRALRRRGPQAAGATPSSYVAGVNAYIDEAQARPHEDARRVRRDRPAARPRPVEGHRHHRHRARWSAGSSARAAARSSRRWQLRRAFVARFGARRGPNAVARLGRARGPRRADDRALASASPTRRRRASRRAARSRSPTRAR